MLYGSQTLGITPDSESHNEPETRFRVFHCHREERKDEALERAVIAAAALEADVV